jgi:hypothetical protein
MARSIAVFTSSVMPARIAGIQAAQDAPKTSMSTWVPAIHAGTTNSCRNVDLRKSVQDGDEALNIKR